MKDLSGMIMALGFIIWMIGYPLGKLFGSWTNYRNQWGYVWRERNLFGKMSKWGLIMMGLGILCSAL